MGKLVVVYGDEARLESALAALADAGLGESTRVIGGGSGPGEGMGAPVDAADYERAGLPAEHAEDATGTGAADGRPVVVPGAAGGPPVVSGVVDPLSIPPGGSRAVGLVGDGPADRGVERDLERLTNNNADEARFYSDAVEGGASILVVEGSDSDLDRAEAALAGNEGQGMEI